MTLSKPVPKYLCYMHKCLMPVLKWSQGSKFPLAEDNTGLLLAGGGIMSSLGYRGVIVMAFLWYRAIVVLYGSITWLYLEYSSCMSFIHLTLES